MLGPQAAQVKRDALRSRGLALQACLGDLPSLQPGREAVTDVLLPNITVPPGATALAAPFLRSGLRQYKRVLEYLSRYGIR